MSDTSNDNLLEEAAFYIDQYQDTTVGKALERVLATGDLEMLEAYVQQARELAFITEYSLEPSEYSYIEGGKLEVF